MLLRAIWGKIFVYRSDIDPNYEAYPEITEKNIRWLKVILNWKTCLFFFVSVFPSDDAATLLVRAD